MGEIADAIRRARGQGSVGSADSSLKGLDLATPDVQAPPPRQEERVQAQSADWVESIHPDSPAVLPEAGPHAELCRQIALRLREQLELRRARSVAVVSAERGDGKSTVACNLAVALASMSQGRSVALLDLDLRKPSLARYLALAPKPGKSIENVLLGEASLEEVLIPVRHPAIDVYPVHRPQNAAHELLVLPALGEMLAHLERLYEVVVVDTPPAPLVPDASLVLRHVSCCVPVVRKGKTRLRSIRRLLQCLPSRSFAGWIVNCDHASEFHDEDYYYHDGDGR